MVFSPGFYGAGGERGIVGRCSVITADYVSVSSTSPRRAINLAHVHLALPAAVSCRLDQGGDQLPLRVRNIARITQTAMVVASTIFVRPHRRPHQE